jgi:hypothetical protein
MNTMSPSADAVDDLLDARSEVRRLRKLVLQQRIALKQAKESLAGALERVETCFDELEQRQGRLPFGDDAGSAPLTAGQADAARPSNGSAKLTVGKGAPKHAAAAAGRAGQSSWKETR